MDTVPIPTTIFVFATFFATLFACVLSNAGTWAVVITLMYMTFSNVRRNRRIARVERRAATR